MRIVIPGEPIAKGRPRFNRATGTTYTPAATKAYEQTIAFLAMSRRSKIEEGPVRVGVAFFTARKRPSDIDNLIKAVMDGCNGQAFTDDSQVVEIHAATVRSANPRVEILIEPCELLSEE